MAVISDISLWELFKHLVLLQWADVGLERMEQLARQLITRIDAV